MSKKKMKELEKERVNFIHGNEELGIDGAIKRGVPEAVAASLFDEIMDFATHAFNKAHAVCYAVVSFRTAYLKCHYPREYMAARSRACSTFRRRSPSISRPRARWEFRCSRPT